MKALFDRKPGHAPGFFVDKSHHVATLLLCPWMTKRRLFRVKNEGTAGQCLAGVGIDVRDIELDAHGKTHITDILGALGHDFFAQEFVRRGNRRDDAERPSGVSLGKIVENGHRSGGGKDDGCRFAPEHMKRRRQFILLEEKIAGGNLLPAESCGRIGLAAQPKRKTVIGWHVSPAFDQLGKG
ncbi:hypothetical protein [Mesorhizobium loti]|uniref:hypothetical protein n=1 Tax=Rhizobium loti TaxID=381 RepID=UPI0012BCA92B|nr:hypothetical protein [Mesorhizobium loti]